MKITDTLTTQKTSIELHKHVKIYLCGVTVYDDVHIGHARTVIVFDVLRRYLESIGKKINFIQNFTDVDDKIINKANMKKKRADEISCKYIKNYHRDFDELNVIRADAYPKATEHIDEMIQLIAGLLEKNMAYISTNGVYFSVSKFSEYGKLSKKRLDDLHAGARIEIDEDKRDPLDFALWKFATDEPRWSSPWGDGRPGWHIECSAMSIKYLGNNFDIHGGGRDLIFPHHENEIAQSEGYWGGRFAKVWMHVGMVTINGEKMSKSLNNIKTVRDALEYWNANIIRLFCLSGHYSKPIDYTNLLLKESLTRWRQLETAWYELIQAEPGDATDNTPHIVQQCHIEFERALKDDFNTHEALSAFFKIIKMVNNFSSDKRMTQGDADTIMPEFKYCMNVFGLVMPDITKKDIESINNMVKQRTKTRKEGRYDEADRIRDDLTKMGIELLDHKFGTSWIKRESVKAAE